MPVVTVFVAAPEHMVVIEEDEPRAVRTVRIERRRPVAAEGTRTEENRAATSSGKEYTVPVGRFNQSTIDSAAIVVHYPSPGTLCP